MGTYNFLKCLKEKETHLEKWKKVCTIQGNCQGLKQESFSTECAESYDKHPKEHEGGNEKQKERQISCRSIIKKRQ